MEEREEKLLTKKKNRKATLVDVLLFLMNIFVGVVLTLVVLNIYTLKTYGLGMIPLNSSVKGMAPLLQAKSIVESSFYQETDSDTLLDGAIDGYMSALDDKYSRYENPETQAKSQVQNEGKSVGIGVVISLQDDGYIYVQDVTADTPAQRAGIQSGDVIKSINGNDVAEYGYENSIQLIKDGEADTSVDVVVLRGDQELNITIDRTLLEVSTADGKMLDGDIAYIRITHFYINTPDQFNEIYQELISQGAKGVIFDLRDNTGGYTNSVQGCLNDLVPKGDIAEATYRDGSTSTIVKSTSDDTLQIPSVVITNGYTASAGEIFSSAMREFCGSKLVGENTYGKGVMQNTQPLTNGGAIILTVATYNIVGNECYHGVGLAPDYEVVLDENSTEDTQLNKSIEVINELIANADTSTSES
jgi:carboxyl-terminal processing protease